MQWRPALPEPPVNTILFPVGMMVVIEGDNRRETETMNAGRREKERDLPQPIYVLSFLYPFRLYCKCKQGER